MTYEDSEQMYYYECPCGDKFEISLEDLYDGEDIAPCPSCTLQIKVIFKEVSVCSNVLHWCHWLFCRLRLRLEVWSVVSYNLLRTPPMRAVTCQPQASAPGLNPRTLPPWVAVLCLPRAVYCPLRPKYSLRRLLFYLYIRVMRVYTRDEEPKKILRTFI